MKFMEKRSFWSFCSVPLYHDFSNRTIAPVSTKIRAIYGNTFITKFMKRTRFSVRPNRLRCITISRKTLTCNVSFSLDVNKRLVIPWSRHIRMRIHRIYDNVEHTLDENVLLLKGDILQSPLPIEVSRERNIGVTESFFRFICPNALTFFILTILITLPPLQIGRIYRWRRRTYQVACEGKLAYILARGRRSQNRSSRQFPRIPSRRKCRFHFSSTHNCWLKFDTHGDSRRTRLRSSLVQ